MTAPLIEFLPAVILFVIFIGALLAAVVSVILLRLYRRATLRGMGQSAGAEGFIPIQNDIREDTAPISRALTIEILRDELPLNSAPEVQAAYRRTAKSVRTTAAIYAAGGLAYALILATPWMIVAGDSFFLGRYLWLVAINAWPIVLGVNLVTGTNRFGLLGTASGYFALLLAIAIYILIGSPSLSILDLIFLWLMMNAPGTLLLLAFLHRRVRAVGPLVFAFMVAGVTGALLAIEGVNRSDALLRNIIIVGDAVGLGASALFALMTLLGFAAFGLLGWWLLGLMARQYRAKRFSDQSLTIDSIWLLFAIVQPITLAVVGFAWIFTGLVGFAAYKLATILGFRFFRKRIESGTGAPMLLLLRVFALGSRSEQFFDVFSKWWRRSGSISMIAGPDLVTTAVEPHEFLDFVGGRLTRQFVQSEADLERRLASLDRQPDPDGFYRVNEFFCREDTWQMTMRALAMQSDAVLMDLRSFSPSNQGSLYEIEQLLNIVDLERIAFLVDETSDLPFLEEMLQRMWTEVNADSPNYIAESPTARLFQAGDQTGRSAKALLLVLLNTGELSQQRGSQSRTHGRQSVRADKT